MAYRFEGTVSKHVAHSVTLRCGACRHIGVFHAASHEIPDAGWSQGHVTTTGARVSKNWSAGIRRCPNPGCGAVTFVVQAPAGKVVLQVPPEVIDFDATALPPPILATLEEAVKCHSAGAYKASALMVRRLLEELCQDRGAKGKDLKARLSDLGTNVVVPGELLDAADQLRLLGNDAAHIEAKSYDVIGAEEAELAIELSKELLKAVYQYGSLVERLKALKRPQP